MSYTGPWMPIEGIDEEHPPSDAFTLHAYDEGSGPEPGDEGLEFIIDVATPPLWLRWLGFKTRVRLWSEPTGWRTLAWFSYSGLAIQFAQTLANSLVKARNDAQRKPKA